MSVLVPLPLLLPLLGAAASLAASGRRAVQELIAS